MEQRIVRRDVVVVVIVVIQTFTDRPSNMATTPPLSNLPYSHATPLVSYTGSERDGGTMRCTHTHTQRERREKNKPPSH